MGSVPSVPDFPDFVPILSDFVPNLMTPLDRGGGGYPRNQRAQFGTIFYFRPSSPEDVPASRRLSRSARTTTGSVPADPLNALAS